MSNFQARPVYRLRQQVEGQLRTAIVSKQVSEGERLPSEAELAEQFSVSRSTIREALRSLTASGLIVKSPGAGGGSFVRKLDIHTFGEMLSESVALFVDLGNAHASEVAALRDLLEIPAARLAAENRTSEDVALLFEIVQAQKEITSDDPAVPNLDIRFHTAIAAAGRNRVLNAFVFALHAVNQPVTHIDLTPEIGRKTVAQHLQVVRAIEAGDPAAAEAAIRKHLDYLKTLQPTASVASSVSTLLPAMGDGL